MVTIYLDQNAWILLARRVLATEQSGVSDSLVETILDKSEQREWVFPLSIVHHMETMARLDDRSRVSLARVMSDISRNHSVLPYVTIEDMELRNSVYRLHDIKPFDIHKEIITNDFFRAAGLDGNSLSVEGDLDSQSRYIFETFAQQLLERTDLFFRYMSQTPNRETVTRINIEKRRDQDKLVQMREELYKIPVQHRYKAFVAKEYLAKFSTKLIGLAHEFGVTCSDLVPDSVFKTEESTQRFLLSVPSFDTMVNLMFQICRNPERLFHENDFHDMVFLAVAVPYCDVVITEKSWVHHIRQAGLDTKYDTIVLKSIDDLLDLV